MKLKIATRKSLLALWQSEFVAGRLREMGHECELLELSTRGDEVLDRSLAAIGGKNLFIKELEIAMQQGRAQLAVHSLKDVGAELAEDFVLAAVCAREDERDVVVLRGDLGGDLAADLVGDLAGDLAGANSSLSAQNPRASGEAANSSGRSANPGASGEAGGTGESAALGFLPRGATVGTTSLRRCLQLRQMRPDLRIKNLRGNLQTRLAKLDAGEYDAIVLARAGLARLGLLADLAAAGRVVALSQTQMISAAGQGAVAIEAVNDPALLAVLKQLECPRTRALVSIERDFTRVLNGGCGAPIGINASVENAAAEVAADGGASENPAKPDAIGKSAELVIRAIVGSPDGANCIQMTRRHPLGPGGLAEHTGAGEALARAFIAAGALELIKDCKKD